MKTYDGRVGTDWLRTLPVVDCEPLTTNGYCAAWTRAATIDGNMPELIVVPPQLALSAHIILAGPLQGSAEILMLHALSGQPTRWYVWGPEGAVACDAEATPKEIAL